MLGWIKNNVLKWTAFVAVLTFIFGPFIQERLSDSLESVFFGENIAIYACSPLMNSTLIISAANGDTKKVHSASHYPFLQGAQIVIQNRSSEPVPDSFVFVAPLNRAENHLLSANFFSDNNTSADIYKVKETGKNAFNISLGNFAHDQTLVLNFGTLVPTTFVVEFSGQTESNKRIINSGNCDGEIGPKRMVLPVDFYSKGDFPEVEDEKLMGRIPDIEGAIGNVKFEVVLDYDCGDGPEQQIVEMGGGVEYCNIKINM